MTLASLQKGKLFIHVLTKYLVYLLQWHTQLRKTNLTVTHSIPLHRKLSEFRSRYFIFFSKERLFNETESPARKVLLFSFLSAVHLLITNPLATCPVLRGPQPRTHVCLILSCPEWAPLSPTALQMRKYISCPFNNNFLRIQQFSCLALIILMNYNLLCHFFLMWLYLPTIIKVYLCLFADSLLLPLEAKLHRTLLTLPLLCASA